MASGQFLRYLFHFHNIFSHVVILIYTECNSFLFRVILYFSFFVFVQQNHFFGKRTTNRQDQSQKKNSENICLYLQHRENNPFALNLERENGEAMDVAYTPGESTSLMFGGNSNWRGPIWLCSMYNLLL